MSTTEFSSMTFLERVARAAHEPVYSAALAWLLDDASPVPIDQRQSIIEQLAGVKFARISSVQTDTEWKNIDLILRLTAGAKDYWVAIENKIKASDGERQLAIYDAKLQEVDVPVRKVFLTLAGERPRSGSDWRSVSYRQLAESIRSQPSSNTPYVNDLCEALMRMALVAEHSLSDADLVAAAFADKRPAAPSSLLTYVDRLKLRKLVQRIWMAALADKINISEPWQSRTDETNGQALLDLRGRLSGNVEVLVGIQIQNRALKLNAVPYPYPQAATPEQHSAVAQTLERIRRSMDLSSDLKPSAAGARGFRSFTVAQLPDERHLGQWVDVTRPWVDRLVSSFPDVTAVRSD